MSRGGKREGAGRPADGELTELVRMRCSPATRALIRAMAEPGESDSDVLRAAVALLAETRRVKEA